MSVWDTPPAPERVSVCYTCARAIGQYERRRRIVEGQEVCARCCHTQGFKLDPVRL